MPATQERYLEMLMERIREDQYPSPQLLDRIEAAIWTPEQFHAYVELLIDKADQAWYTSPQLLDRIQRMLAVAASV
ncbi:MAG: hypothetical protein WCB67_05445 [Solirubrobacteraceae bacterium]